jgi:hypothetical protein
VVKAVEAFDLKTCSEWLEWSLAPLLGDSMEGGGDVLVVEALSRDDALSLIEDDNADAEV